VSEDGADTFNENEFSAALITLVFAGGVVRISK
jgi:hypothetical protein